ncbi:hypothetical protein DHW03_14125 [Pedobacter yonginense]|uniref:Uncharacterized protein n=1 Tax=Pedobacter yonginense TaxID=651869 RepID=A0A317EL78_9SPHI|nr:hypothetical protein [Pedobacter yonginense]PWS27135.1 hypothetical protein DHW03_14125 [Pedobacter yonginense]
MPIVLNEETSLEILENLQIGYQITDGKAIDGHIIGIEILNATSGKLFKISIDSGKIFFLTFSLERPAVNSK